MYVLFKSPSFVYTERERELSTLSFTQRDICVHWKIDG